MKRIIMGVAALAAATVGTIVTAPTADAATVDRRPCVTAGEWRQIHPRQTPATVARILDGRGTDWWSATDGYDRFFTYRPCASFGSNRALVVWYDAYSYGNGWHVWDKYRSANGDTPR